jgi:hypothetical protein
MSGLAAAYTSTFRPVQPLQGAAISELAASILGSQPMETARLQAGLANTGLASEGNLINTTLVNRQRTKELEMEIAAQQKARDDVTKANRRASLMGTLLQGASALGGNRSNTRAWALNQIAQDAGDGMARAGNRWGVGQTLFQGAQALNNPAVEGYIEAYRNSGRAGAGLPLPTS